MLTGRALGEAAWEYWGQHGLAVFPCKSDKRPLTPRGFKDAVTGEDAILELFEQFGDAAAYIGLPTGQAGLFALDFDLYKDGAERFKQELARAKLLPETRVHSTPSGGEHYFYYSPEGENVRSGAPVPGVEVRGVGGYVIVPPSRGYEVAHDERVALAPDGLVQRLATYSREFSRNSDEALEALILQADSFHEAYATLAARKQARGESMADTLRALQLLHDASVARSTDHPRHSRWAHLSADKGKELSRIVTSAYKKFNPDRGERKLREQRAQRRAAEPTPEDEEGSDQEEAIFDRAYDAFDAGDLDKDRGFMLWPLIMQGDVVVLSAEPKAGKTLFTLNMALSIASGIPFGDLTPIDNEGNISKMPVVYLALEGQGAVRKRIVAWMKVTNDARAKDNQPPLSKEDVLLTVVEQPFDLTSAKAKQYLADRMAVLDDQLKARGLPPTALLVVDTLTKAMPGKDQNSVEDTSAVFEAVSMLRDVGVECSVLYVHHNKRDGSSPRGSGNIMAEPDTVLTLKKQADKVLEGRRINTAEVSVLMARAVDDTFTQEYMFDSVDIGRNSQGIEMQAPVLTHVRLVSDRSEGESSLTERHNRGRAAFFDFIVASSLSSGAASVTEIDKEVRSQAPDLALSYYSKYRKPSKAGLLKTWSIIASEPHEEGWRIVVDQAKATVELELDLTTRRAAG